MESEQKDFKAVKVQMKASQKQGEALSRSMLYSGINIFGQLSQVYLQNKDQFGHGQISTNVTSQDSNSSVGSQSTLSQEGSMMHLTQDVLAIFKRLQKKDPVTKIKAFQELDKYLETVDAQCDELQHLLTFFLYHFCRVIMNEADKKVREASHDTFLNFIKKDKKRLGPHLKKVFSLWYCSFFDPSNEVSAKARRNFELAFPEAKREQVFKISFKNFLHFSNEQLKQSEDQVAQESSGELSKGQREDIFDRVTSSVLQALADSFNFTRGWDEEEANTYKMKLIDILDLNLPIQQASIAQEEIKKDGGNKQQQPQKQIKTQSKHQSYLWRFLQPSYRGRVRSSCLIFISQFIHNLNKEVIDQHISQISPLVYGLIGENNSILQTTLWRETLFPLAQKYPISWSFINIKKDFLPKLYGTLKHSGYGAPTALYENFVKFVSVFPFYHLYDYKEDKANKASFKERVNLIREVFSNLYSGLKNDESVAFHQDLISSFFETLTFILLKRIQPFIITKEFQSEEVQFVLSAIKKIIQTPLTDFIANYEKLRSKAQNERNIRVTIPSKLQKMLVDLSERQFDQQTFQSICDFIFEEIGTIPENLDKVNSLRIVSGLMKISKSDHFYSNIYPQIILKFYQTLQGKLTNEINDLGRQTIDSVLKKSQNLLTLIYRLNKHQIVPKDGDFDVIRLIENIKTISKKEELSQKVLSPDDLRKFSILKQNLVKSVILCFNMNQEGDIKQFLEFILKSQQFDFETKQILLLPQSDFKKIDFSIYFERINKSGHDLIIQFIDENILDNPNKIISNWRLLNSGLILLDSQKPSFILIEDESYLINKVQQQVKQLRSTHSLSSYFNALQTFLINPKNSNIKQLREELFDKLLQSRSTEQGYDQLWTLFEKTLKALISNKDQNLQDYCLEKLKEQLKNIINSNSNFEIDAFTRFTYIVKQFVQLCSNKQQIIEDILLQEENFSNLDKNSLPMKIFRDLFLSGGVGFDVSQLFREQKSQSYAWLAASLLHAKHLTSLSTYIQLKNQLVVFLETEIIPVLVDQVKTGSNSRLIIDIAKYIIHKAQDNQSWVYTLEYLLRKMIDPGENFSSEEKPVLKISEFKEIFDLVGTSISEKILLNQSENIEYDVEFQLFTKVLRLIAYFIIDEQNYQDIFKKAEQQLKNYIDIKKKPDQFYNLNLEVYLSLFEYLGNQETVNQRSSSILVYLLQSQKEIVNDAFLLNTTLQFSSHVLNKFGVQEFKKSLKDQNFQQFLNEIIQIYFIKHLQPITYIHLFNLIRKTIGTDLIQDKQKLITQVLSIAKDHSISVDMKLQRIQQHILMEEQNKEENKKVNEVEEEDDESIEVEDFEFEMLQDLAETLLVFPNYLDSNVEENDLYLLIGSGIESLQKAAFVLLKYLYENYLPELKYSVDESDQIKQLKIEEDQKDQSQKQSEGDQEEIKQSEKEHDHEEHEKKKKYKNKLAFRNISEILIEIIENPPSLSHQDQNAGQSQSLIPSSHIEALIYGENIEGCMNQKLFGYFLAWNAFLTKIENGRIKAQLSQQIDQQVVLGAINEYLEENEDIYQMLLVSMIAYLPQSKRGLADNFNVQSFQPEYLELNDQKQNGIFCVFTLTNFMKCFPSLGRKYYQECGKQLVDIVTPYIKQVVSPAILENEIKKIELAQVNLGSNELTFQLFKSTKEILATYQKGEISMQLRIKIPANYPLQMVEVEVTKSIKISERQMRKWILSIRKIVQMQNGDIITAVLQWKSNIDKEIEGVEECYICYCVVHDKDQSLPKMPCKNCKNKFHLACIRKWFRTSNKSNCPLCQNYFF